MTLAQQCGIEVAPFRTAELGNRYATFLTRRFDRTDDHRRIHFTSAMTMLGYTDGETDGVSYLELADWIARSCCHVEYNLAQMWRRIVFNIAISNCDDHLRTHGFLLTKQGWTLSPAYDLNPQPYGVGLSMNINEHDNALDFALAKEVSPYFGLTAIQANKEIDSIQQAVSRWRVIASKAHISRDEQERMAPAFER